MSGPVVIPYDGSLLAEVSARMDLRTPNAEALDVLARCFNAAAGKPFEAVCDMATGVGKTYLAAGLVDYLAASGVRHAVVVTPGRTILEKTIANFTPGHPKSLLGGMGCTPTVVTAETFDSGATAAALADENTVKLFVFTVQQLIRPKAKASRRTRVFREWLGTELYSHLRATDDLVVIADESHAYAEKAVAFHDAVRDLRALATVGLTATPSPSDEDKVVYRYPLARAIADRFVKTPVLVGRRDKATDVATRLRDGLALLAAKATAVERYTAATGAETVNPVMFVVADTIDNANAVAEVLRRDDLLGDTYDEAVLVIHSQAPDDALARLDAVEAADSAVRVIVSVSMLKEGWDVRNIFVICSLRPSISEALTEQTLGRGLRLPWGVYTGIELLDTVEVLSHERYEELLEKADVLLEGLVETRAVKPGPAAPGPAAATSPASPTSAGTPTVTVGVAREPAASGPVGVVPVIATEDRIEKAGAEAAMARVVEARATLRFPRVETTFAECHFELSTLDEAQFEDLGCRLAAHGGGTLRRTVIEIRPDPTRPEGYTLDTHESTDDVEATAAQLPVGGAEKGLVDRILADDAVEATAPNIATAKRLAAAVVRGAGGEDQLASYFDAALDGVQTIVRTGYRAVPPVRALVVTETRFGPRRVSPGPPEPNRTGPFATGVAYEGWKRSLHAENWFDSKPERTLALRLDEAVEVRVWARILRGDLTISWAAGSGYTPDFYAETAAGHYLFEVKADRDVDRPEVKVKAEAAEEWVRTVTADGRFGEWRYLLVSETDLASTGTLAALIRRASP